MTARIINGETKGTLTKQEKVVSLFNFIKELNKLKQKVVLNVSDYPWWRSIASFPNDEENIREITADGNSIKYLIDIIKMSRSS